MKADINITFAALNSYFLNTATMQINADYLNDLLDIQIHHSGRARERYKEMKQHRRKSNSFVWEAFIELANEKIAELEEPRKREHAATNYHLKKWLDTYGNGLETIAPTVEMVEDYRKSELWNE